MGTKGTNNRQLILQAANHLFHVRGYNQTSFSDISDETGIPKGNFYYYFKTKEDILDAVVDARVMMFRGMLDQCDAETEDPLKRLLIFSDMLIQNEDALVNYGCPVGSLTVELAKDSITLQEKAREVFAVIRNWMGVQFDAMGIENSDELAMDLLARMQGVSLMACAFKDHAFLKKSKEDLESWLSSLRPN